MKQLILLQKTQHQISAIGCSLSHDEKCKKKLQINCIAWFIDHFMQHIWIHWMIIISGNVCYMSPCDMNKNIRSPNVPTGFPSLNVINLVVRNLQQPPFLHIHKGSEHFKLYWCNSKIICDAERTECTISEQEITRHWLNLVCPQDPHMYGSVTRVNTGCWQLWDWIWVVMTQSERCFSLSVSHWACTADPAGFMSKSVTELQTL